MTDRPILFSGPMVLGLLDGRKTMTRRMAWRAPNYDNMRDLMRVDMQNRIATVWQRVEPGDRLWVRETAWFPEGTKNPQAFVSYRADHGSDTGLIWTPSIHMPRWASRFTLVVTATKIERLQEISEKDAVAEGAMFHDGHGVGHSGWRHDFKDVHVDARSAFARFWGSFNGKDAWKANPEVVALTFDVRKANIDQLEKAK